ncbi:MULTISPECIES: efflux RND transporter periplasmic adaptor subunit [unclassified Massilia]|uniref:efflux RND transporter periplasmic adaptor subunit n=1 Tax=unclassified Massilia TaxID=2609279 RepID=UPI0017832396|nr:MULTISPECIES: efflux RND transporter periplasmic adaptor subunit [unclassified Massilia]MBD8528877.1 efflux RND transporter periplasmic adaptor subunit [Massilia sp. CFBP 13647]MBD8673519.1 efflux RND transporter periplasmic adaptor subunit [Massilia sp. CFBP 13721]
MRSAHSSPLSLTRIAACTLMAVTLLSACGKKDAAQAPGAGGQMPAPEVGVVTTKFEQVALQTELPARAEPVRVAQVRARVNGVVLKRLFTEGSEVKEGQSLYQIDPAPYQAQLAAAQADLGRAQATLTQAAAQAERYKPLVEANAISKQEYTNAVAAQKQAEAAVAASRAQVRINQINAGYASVNAPISGRIGRALVTEGALVSATEGTELAVIQQTNSMYLNITQSASEVQRLRKQAGGGAKDASVTVILDDGTELPTRGKLLFSDVTVDPGTAQVTLRATVPNPDNALLPGQYVRVRLAQAELPNGIVVPQQAVTRGGAQGDTLMVVGPDNKPTPRTVKIASQQGSSWVVTEGLKEGERVMVDGFQKLQMLPPGTPVKAVPWQATAPAGAAPAGPQNASANAGQAAAATNRQLPASAPSGSTAGAAPAAASTGR